jgi:pyruvate dehydrogenase E1 component beta subunit
MPSTPYDAKGLLLGSIRDNNPVIFIEYRRLYDEVGPVPEEPYSLPIGKGTVRCAGKDLTLVAISYMVLEALWARQSLDRAGIEVEIIDPRTLRPLDEETILESVKKTGRLVIADTGWKSCGVAAEVAALAAEKCFHYLKSPVGRVALPDVPTPTSRALEEAFYPGSREIVQAVCDVMGVDTRIKREILASAERVQDSPPRVFLGPF